MNKERFKLRCAVYLILERDGMILLSRRCNTGWMDGKYSLISGHLDGNESVFEAIIREAREEAQIELSKIDLRPATVVHYRAEVEYISFFFAANKWKGKISIGESDKCSDLKWFPKDKLPDDIIPEIKEAIEKHHERVVFYECGWKNIKI